MNTKKQVALLIVCVSFFLKGYGEIKFKTEWVKNTFEMLSPKLQQTIGTPNPEKSVIPFDDVIAKGNLRVVFNSDNQLAQLGIALTASELSNKYTDEIKFVENLLLNICISEKGSFLFKYIRHNDIEFFKNNKLHPDFTPVEWKKIIGNIVQSEMNIHYKNLSFYATWIFGANESFTIKFPANINLVKMMNKIELEEDLLNDLSVHKPTNFQVIYDKKSLEALPNELFIMKGEKFETDYFRSDIYLYADNTKGYVPVFSDKYPAESFSNMFVANLQNKLAVNAVFVLYNQRQSNNSIPFNTLNSRLAQQCRLFYGTSKLSNDSLEATVIYYNDTYKYVHMLVAKTMLNTLFDNSKNAIEATVYLYIPRSDLKKIEK